MKPIRDAGVAAVFDAYPRAVRRKLSSLRQLILETAARTEGVGEIEETLKWGEPSYAPVKARIGTAVRIDWKKAKPSRYAMYFHCQTNLLETFRARFPTQLTYEGTRSIVFDENDVVPVEALSWCIAAALTYHRNKKRAAR